MSDESMDLIKKSIQDRADIAIERIQSFLDKDHCYTLSLEPDLFGTGRIWFVKARKESSYLILAVITDANRIAAEEIMRCLAMMLLVTGHSVQNLAANEFEFHKDDISQMKELEKFFLRMSFNISYAFNPQEKLYSILINNEEKQITLLEVGGISERGISVVCKQIALILGGLGKHFSTQDGTIGNRYGLVEFCPQKTEPEEPGDKNEDLPF
jgi:hypothetical protein